MGLIHKNSNRKTESTPQIVHDFQRRLPYWSYRARGYEKAEPSQADREAIDKYLEALFSGEIDDGNHDVLDNLISDRVRQKKNDYKMQRVENRDMIHSYGIRAEADCTAFCQRLELLKNEREVIMEEMSSLRDRIRSFEFREGR